MTKKVVLLAIVLVLVSTSILGGQSSPVFEPFDYAATGIAGTLGGAVMIVHGVEIIEVSRTGISICGIPLLGKV